MGDSFVTIIAIFLAAILMFVFPLMSISERTDDVSQLSVQTATTEFVDKVRTTGKLTLDDYDKYVQTITSTGNSFEVSMQAQILDENPGVKTTQAETTKIGENVYYSQFTSQIMDTLDKNGVVYLKEGDLFSTSVKNTNTTMSQQLEGFLYKVSGGNDTYSIAAEHAGMVTANGTGK